MPEGKARFGEIESQLETADDRLNALVEAETEARRGEERARQRREYLRALQGLIATFASVLTAIAEAASVSFTWVVALAAAVLFLLVLATLAFVPAPGDTGFLAGLVSARRTAYA